MTSRKKNHKKTRRVVRKNKSARRRGLIFLLVLFLLLGMVSVGLYFYSPLGRLFSPIYERLPFPIVLTGKNKKIITSSQLMGDLKAVKNFYEHSDLEKKGLRVDFSTEKGKMRLKIKKKEILNKLIENNLIEEMANQNKLSISKDELSRLTEKKAGEIGGRSELKLKLKKLYGWSIAEYQENILKYEIYLNKLFKHYQTEIKKTDTGYQKIIQAKQELDKGVDFKEVVKKYSEGRSVEKEGELGWFKKNQLVASVAEKAFSMKSGEVSPIIISPLGYHIILVEQVEKKEQANSEAVSKVKIRQIFVRGKNFSDWIMDKKKNFPVTVLAKEYIWDKNMAQIIFSDKKMIAEESSIRAQSVGDPTF